MPGFDQWTLGISLALTGVENLMRFWLWVYTMRFLNGLDYSVLIVYHGNDMSAIHAKIEGAAGSNHERTVARSGLSRKRRSVTESQAVTVKASKGATVM